MAELNSKPPAPPKRRQNLKVGPLIDRYCKDPNSRRAAVDALKPFLPNKRVQTAKSQSTEAAGSGLRMANFQATLPVTDRARLKFQRVDVPRFHFPYGQPQNKQNVRLALSVVVEIFNRYDGQADLDCMGEVAQAVGLPFYLRQPLFSVCSGDSSDHVTFQEFQTFWTGLTATYHDEAALAVRVLTKNTADCLLPLDLIAVVQDVIDHHPGLECLRDAQAYHSTYLQTVISRIFFDVGRHWSDRLYVNEVRRSKLLPALRMLEQEENINNIRDYFSYEHFYVIYSTFWYLDDDHDLFITKADLARYSNQALSSRIIDRIVSKAVNYNLTDGQCKMAYTDFIWFLLAEEDKTHPKSVEYWFRCMDLDGDGVLSLFELEYFYDEQVCRLEQIGIMAPAFPDIACQMLDLIKPALGDRIALSDLKRSRHTAFFFDTFFNREKFVLHEENDSARNSEFGETDGESDWDRFARRAYLGFAGVDEEQMELNCDTDEEERDDAEDEDMDQVATEVNHGREYLQLAGRLAALSRPRP